LGKHNNKDDLRQRAECILKSNSEQMLNLDPGDIDLLIQEFRIHQIELSLQNEELRKSQQELIQASEKYRELYNFMPVGYLLLDKDGVILEANLTARAFLGMDKQLLIATPLSTFICKQDQDIFYLHRKQVSSNQRHTCEIRFVKMDDTLLWVQLESSLVSKEIPDSSGIWRTVFFDISERKLADELLRKASVYNRSLIEASLDPLLAINSDGKITDCNTAAKTLTGLTREDLIGTNFSDHFTDSNKAIFGYKKVLSDGSLKNYELALKHKTRRATPVVFNASLYRDENGKILGIFAVARDITDRKRIEEELLRSNQDLQQFAYVVSHDLQEPLRNIVGCFQMIQKFTLNLDEKPAQFMTYAIESAKRMKNLIEDLLNFSRVSKTHNPLKLISAESILQSAMRNLSFSIADSHAKITYGELPFIRVEPTQFTMVFQNLIGNAIKFKNRDIPEIQVFAQKNGDEWIFSVRDNGIGIDRQYHERIFNIFQRLHAGAEYEGTGIGLAIVKKIVEHHGGRIWLESEMGVGTVFYFSILDEVSEEQKSE
jgi:PAS domain S-box-containing protein